MTAERKMLLKWAFAFLFPAILLLLPTGEIYTKEIRSYVAVTTFFICMAAMDLMPILLNGLLLPVLYVIFGVCKVQGALKPWSSSFLIWMVIGGFLLAFALEESGLIKRMVYWATLRCKAKFNRLVYALMLAGFFTMFITFSRAWLIIIVLCASLAFAMNMKDTMQGVIIFLVAQIVACIPLVISYTPSVTPIITGSLRMTLPEYYVEFFTQIYYGWPIIPEMFLIIFLLMKITRTDKAVLSGGMEYFQAEYKKLGPITTKEKKAAAYITVLLLFMLTSRLHGVDPAYAFTIMPILMYLPGIGVAGKEAMKKLDLGIIIFIASCVSIGIIGGEVGAGKALISAAGTSLENCPRPIFLMGCLFIGIIANIFMTPGAVAALLPGPLAALGIPIGISNPILPAISVYACNELVFFPFQNSYVLVLFGFGIITMRQFIKFNIIKMFMFIALFPVFLFPWWYFTGM